MSRKCSRNKRVEAALVPFFLAFGVSTAGAGNVGVDVNIHLGDQPRPVVVREAAPPVPAPVVAIDEDVHFVYPEPLGVYVAVGVPYDLFFLKNKYYFYRDGHWFRAHGSHGPWVPVAFRELPPGLRRYKIERMRNYRNAEYDIYRRDRDHYHGRHFVTGKEEWKAHRKEEKREEKEYRKEVRRAEKEERREHRGGRHDND